MADTQKRTMENTHQPPLRPLVLAFRAGVAAIPAMARRAPAPRRAPSAAGAGSALGTAPGLRRARGLSAVGAACAAVALVLLSGPGPATAGDGGSARAPAAVTAPALPSRAAAAPKAAGCLVEPDRWADIGSPVIGIVEQLAVERGDRVGRGALLVQLRASVEQASQTAAETRARADAELRAAELAAVLAEQRWQRSRALEAERFISPLALEQAAGELELARQRVAQARTQQRIWADESRIAAAQLSQRSVRAPFDGIVVDRFVNLGERVEDRPLVRLAVVDPLRVELMVPVTHWGRLRPGDTLMVKPELPGAEPVSARVSQVDRVLDAASNSFRVRLKLPNPGHRLPAGMRCKVDLDSVVQAARPKASARTARASGPAAKAPPRALPATQVARR